MVRLAAYEDIPELVEMGRAFHEAKQKRYEFVEKDTALFFAGMIDGGVVLRSDGGFLVGAAMGAPSNSKYLTAHEIFWWAEDGSGQRLRRAFEKWAEANGCADVIFSHPESETVVNRMLTKAGYEAEAQMMRRDLQCA